MRFFRLLWQWAKLKITIITSGCWLTIILVYFTDRSSHKLEARLARLGKQAAKAAHQLGPAYIKLGQFLSTRPDLISQAAAEGLATLQDKVPPFPFAEVKKTIHKELGRDMDEIFKHFASIPTAAASIAQVHKAITKDGHEVAVKVLRPDIEARFMRDLEFFDFVAWAMEGLYKDMRRLKLKEIANTLRQLVRNELDLRFEAAGADQLKSNLDGDDNVYVPTVYWRYSAKRVLTVEWIDGISIYHTKELIRAGHDPHVLASRISVTFFNQAFRDGFFHADIHPGNILVDHNGRICLLDFGITAHLPIKDRMFIAEILHGFITRDYQKVADLHFDAGYVPAHKDRELFALACRFIGEPIIGQPLQQISIANLLQKLFTVSREFEMETQLQLLMLQKTMVTIEGAGYVLYPEVNMWQLAEPWINSWAQENLGWRKSMYNIKSEAFGVVRNLNSALVSLASWQRDGWAKPMTAPRRGAAGMFWGFVLGMAAGALTLWLVV